MDVLLAYLVIISVVCFAKFMHAATCPACILVIVNLLKLLDKASYRTEV